MKNWKITVLKIGTIDSTKGDFSGGLVDKELAVRYPCNCFVLDNGEEKVLVDAGIRDGYAERFTRLAGLYTEGDSQTFLNALAEIGVKPEDITSVIYTHMHFDHAGNCALFANTPSYVHRVEMESLMHPYEFEGNYYPETQEDAKKLKKLILIQHDKVVLGNGLELHRVGGHTRGGMAVVVPTAKGRYVLTGDSPATINSLFPELDTQATLDGEVPCTPVDTQQFLLNPYCTSQYDLFDSCMKLMPLAEKPEPEYFIGSHEPRATVRMFYG